jgi:hypothetical protein
MRWTEVRSGLGGAVRCAAAGGTRSALAAAPRWAGRGSGLSGERREAESGLLPVASGVADPDTVEGPDSLEALAGCWCRSAGEATAGSPGPSRVAAALVFAPVAGSATTRGSAAGSGSAAALGSGVAGASGAGRLIALSSDPA